MLFTCKGFNIRIFGAIVFEYLDNLCLLKVPKMMSNYQRECGTPDLLKRRLRSRSLIHTKPVEFQFFPIGGNFPSTSFHFFLFSDLYRITL